MDYDTKQQQPPPPTPPTPPPSKTPSGKARNEYRDSRYLLNCTHQQHLRRNDQGNYTPVLVSVDKSPSKTNFYVSIHPRSYDPVRWFIHEKHRYYEYYTEHAWKDILLRQQQQQQQQQQRRRKDMTATTTSTTTHRHIIDVGGNIGYYAMYATALLGQGGVRVDVIEPNVINLRRACESLEWNGWNGSTSYDGDVTRPDIRLWNVAISESTTTKDTGTFWLLVPSNPGGARIVSKSDAEKAYQDGKAISVSPVDTITLDDFARVRGWLDDPSSVSSSIVTRIEILKIDVEQHEAHVILGAHQLLRRQVVQHIFIEVARRTYNQTLQGKALQSIIEAGYTWCGYGGFQGAQLGNTPADAVHWSTVEGDWSDHFYRFWATQPGTAMNLWFQLDRNCGRNLVWTFQSFPS